jgi:hypothetical protein
MVKKESGPCAGSENALPSDEPRHQRAIELLGANALSIELRHGQKAGAGAFSQRPEGDAQIRRRIAVELAESAFEQPFRSPDVALDEELVKGTGELNEALEKEPRIVALFREPQDFPLLVSLVELPIVVELHPGKKFRSSSHRVDIDRVRRHAFFGSL